jgi:hypothetical protein
LAPPFREAEFVIDYAHGIDDEASRIMLAQQLGLITKKGGYLVFEGETFRASTVPDAVRTAVSERLETALKQGAVPELEDDDDDE